MSGLFGLSVLGDDSLSSSDASFVLQGYAAARTGRGLGEKYAEIADAVTGSIYDSGYVFRSGVGDGWSREYLASMLEEFGVEWGQAKRIAVAFSRGYIIEPKGSFWPGSLDLSDARRWRK